MNKDKYGNVATFIPFHLSPFNRGSDLVTNNSYLSPDPVPLEDVFESDDTGVPPDDDGGSFDKPKTPKSKQLK